MVTSYAAKGTELQITTAGSTLAFTVVGQVVSIDAPGMKVGKRDVTHLGSVTKEYEATIGDPQEFKGTLLYHPGDAGAVIFQGRVTTVAQTTVAGSSLVVGGDTFKVVFPTTTKLFQFQGVVTEFTPKGGDVEAGWMADFAIQPTRAIVYPTT